MARRSTKDNPSADASEADSETSAEGPPTVRRRNRERTVQTILDAAEDLLDRKGPDGFGLAELGREAGVSFGLIHHYFGGKEGLLRAVLRRAFGKMGREIARLQEDGEFWNHDAPAVQVVIDTFGERPGLARLLAWGLLTGLLRVEDIEEEVRKDREALGRLMRGFRERVPGTTRESAGAQATLLISAVFGYSLLRPLLEDGYDWNQDSDTLLRAQLAQAVSAIARNPS